MSIDGSFELAEKLFSRLDLKATMLRNETPQSIPTNCNRLLSASNGTLVALLSTDDWYAPTYIERIRKAAYRYPDSALYAPNGWSFFENTGALVPSDSPTIDNENVDGKLLFKKDFLFWVGLCYRRAALVHLSGWDEKQTIEDIDLLYRLAKRFPVTQLADHLVYYRRSSSSVSLDPIFMADGRMKFFQKHRIDFADEWNETVGEMLRSSAAVAIDKGVLGSACRLLLQAIYISPLSIYSWQTVFYLLRVAMRRIR